MITREFNLYLHAGHSIPLVINVNQYDQGEQWLFTLFNADGTQYTPSSGAIVGIKSDNLGIINSGSVDSQGRVVINETQQMTAAVGKAVFELLIDDQTHGTANFVVLVEEKPGNNADMSESDLSLLQEAIDATSPLPTGGTVGQVLTKTANGSAWSDAGTPTQEQVASAVSDWADENITVTTGVVIDQSLSVQGAAADAKKTGDEISDLKSEITNLESIPYAVKQAMDTLFSKMAVKDDEVYSDEYATFHAWANTLSVVSISALFTQGNNDIYLNTPLSDLKQYLVVTATYDNSTTAVITDYTLSGTLTAGISTITVTYEGKTTTFTCTVTDAEEITIDWANPSGVTSNTLYSYDSTEGTLRVYRTASTATYQQVRWGMDMVDGYTYKITADATYTLGTFTMCFENLNGDIYTGSSCGWQTSSGHYEATFPMTPEGVSETRVLLCLFCTGATKEKGDVTFSNLKVIKYPTQENS